MVIDNVIRCINENINDIQEFYLVKKEFHEKYPENSSLIDRIFGEEGKRLKWKKINLTAMI